MSLLFSFLFITKCIEKSPPSAIRVIPLKWKKKAKSQISGFFNKQIFLFRNRLFSYCIFSYFYRLCAGKPHILFPKHLQQFQYLLITAGIQNWTHLLGLQQKTNNSICKLRKSLLQKQIVSNSWPPKAGICRCSVSHTEETQDCMERKEITLLGTTKQKLSS